MIVNGLQDVDAVGLIRQCNVNEVACGPGRIGCVGVFCLECVNEDSSPREPGMRVAGDISSEPEITTSNGNGLLAERVDGLRDRAGPGDRGVEVAAAEPVRRAVQKSHPAGDRAGGAGPARRPRQGGIDRTYDIAHHTAEGVAPPERSLEECDAEAIQVGSTANGIALAEGALTGAGGPITTLLDLPLLFGLSLRTIVRIGRCYGFPLDQECDRKFVLGVLIAAASGSLAVRLDRLGQLRDVEDWFLQETQEEIITNEAAALLFQLEIFEEVPAVGAISGGLLNLAFIRRVELTSRRVFQERWLHRRGKVDVIAPYETHARVLAHGWAGALVRAAHAGGYGVGYATALPFWLLAALVRRPVFWPGRRVKRRSTRRSDPMP